MSVPPRVGAVLNSLFIPCTRYVINPYQVVPRTKVGPLKGPDCPGVPELSAHHVGVEYIPVIITDCTPSVAVEDLYSAFIGFSIEIIHQAYRT